MRLSLVLLCAALAGCDFFAAPTSDFRERAAEELAVREVKWDSLAIHDYDFSYIKDCDCPTATPTAVRIEVRGDNVSRVTDDIGTEITAQTAMRWPTVDSLFARARAMISDQSVTITVVFDTTYHFPGIAQTFNERTGDLVRHTASALAPIP
jgi:hypothetical protein